MLYDQEASRFEMLLIQAPQKRASGDKWKLKERELEAPDELSYEREIKPVDHVAREAAVWIPEEGGSRDLGHSSLAQDLRRHS
jgi:hypothetical protein